MRKSSAAPYDPEYLYGLAHRVLLAYKRNRQQGETSIDTRFIDITMQPPNNHRNPYYGYFVYDIEKSTEKSLSGGTVFALLIRLKRNLKFEPQTIFEDYSIDAFELYTQVIQTSQGAMIVKSSKIRLSGARFVDFNFKSQYENDNPNFSRDEFYLNKGGNECQWYGIVRRWNCERILEEKIQSHIVDNYDVSSCVLAVVHGEGGAGKSVLLRQISLSLINETYNTVWVTDIKLFCDDDILVLAQSKDEKYVVFIEDWQYMLVDHALAERLLYRIADSSNIKLVIGDRGPIETKVYFKHLMDGCDFEVLKEDNNKLLKYIGGINKKWQNTIDNLLNSDAFFDGAPIYMIVFVVARIFEGEVKTTTKKARSLFIEIIAFDLAKIGKVYPGLTAALYYFSHVYVEDFIYITWRGLLKIADYFIGHTLASRNLLSLDPENDIIQTLSHYINVQKFVCEYFKDGRYVLFHHTALIEEGIKRITFENIPRYQNNIKAEIAEVLWVNFEVGSALDIIYSLKRDVGRGMRLDYTFATPDIQQIFKGKKSSTVSISEMILFDAMIAEFYNNAGITHTEKYWLSCIHHLFQHVDVGGLELQRMVLKKIIDLECTSRILHEIYEEHIKDNHKRVIELLASMPLNAMFFQLIDRGHIKIWFEED